MTYHTFISTNDRRVVCDERANEIASFQLNEAGIAAFEIFRSGVFHSKNNPMLKLYDEDTKKYLVGSLADMKP